MLITALRGYFLLAVLSDIKLTVVDAGRNCKWEGRKKRRPSKGVELVGNERKKHRKEKKKPKKPKK
jgi:hypothetical protein